MNSVNTVKIAFPVQQTLDELLKSVSNEIRMDVSQFSVCTEAEALCPSKDVNQCGIIEIGVVEMRLFISHLTSKIVIIDMVTVENEEYVVKSMERQNMERQEKKNQELWVYVLRLLTDPCYAEIIDWRNNEGEFCVLAKEAVVTLWGWQKQNDTMCFDRMARSFRTYYGKGILEKVKGERRNRYKRSQTKRDEKEIIRSRTSSMS